MVGKQLVLSYCFILVLSSSSAWWFLLNQCSRSCGGGTRYLVRYCDNPRLIWINVCLGEPFYYDMLFFSIPSLVDGGYSQWYKWFGCSRSCGGGAQTLIRFCDNPWPTHGGIDCRRLGPNVKSQSCNTYKCPGKVL